MKLHAMMLALALAACGAAERASAPAAPEAPDPLDLGVEIGRYDVMLDQVEAHGRERLGPVEPDMAAPRDLARRLRETVWAYNVQRSRLCAKGLYREMTCGPSFEPVWLSEPESAAPSLEDLQARAHGVGEEVMRLWNAVCADAAASVQDEQERMLVCPIE